MGVPLGCGGISWTLVNQLGMRVLIRFHGVKTWGLQGVSGSFRLEVVNLAVRVQLS